MREHARLSVKVAQRDLHGHFLVLGNLQHARSQRGALLLGEHALIDPIDDIAHAGDDHLHRDIALRAVRHGHEHLRKNLFLRHSRHRRGKRHHGAKRQSQQKAGDLFHIRYPPFWNPIGRAPKPHPMHRMRSRAPNRPRRRLRAGEHPSRHDVSFPIVIRPLPPVNSGGVFAL